MLDTFNTIVPSTAQFFEFNCGMTNAALRRSQSWNKPRGVSMIRFLLIGAGGGGANGASNRTGGGSGAVTSWLVPAIFVPDTLIIQPGLGGTGGAPSTGNQSGSAGIATNILLTNSIILLSANGGSGGTASAGAGGTASSADGITTVGIFNSVAGQNGTNADTARTASATTFLSGGAGGSSTINGDGGSVTPNYGYPVLAGGTPSIAANTPGRNGYFITQPIMVGCGGSGGGGGGGAAGPDGGAGGKGGIGCGGGGGGAFNTSGNGGRGGDGGNGAVYIWAW